MKKAIIFGAGGAGLQIYRMIKNDYDVICFTDNDESRWGDGFADKWIESPFVIQKIEFDMIFIASLMGVEDITIQLMELGVSSVKINKEYALIATKSREVFIQNFAELVKKNELIGAVAEAGVYRGEFAKIINREFADRICYLFDIFEGFDERDFGFEKKKSHVEGKQLSKTSVDIVLSKMSFPENCVIRKGYFPETAEGIEENFVFVNLDMDLYKPTYEGLVYFYPRMVEEGIILIHDYFSETYPNVKQAVEDYEKNYAVQLKKMPIGDGYSIAIVK